MSYALKEVQREYQRKWANDKNKARRLEIDREKAEETTSFKLGSKNVVTWAELQGDYFREVGTWGACIKTSREYLIHRKTNKLVVAALAVRACNIRHGGDFKTDKFKQGFYGSTIRKFAEEIGINYKTLWGWVGVKVQVIDILPKDIKQIDYTAAKLSLENKNKSPLSIEKLYERYSSKNSKTRAAYYVTRGLQSLASQLSVGGISAMTQEERKEALVHLRAINRAFGI